MTAKTVLLVFAFALTLLFVACGDDDSSSFVEPEKESSSSEILSSSDGTSDGNGDKSSSSVSSSSTNSSSSAKSSSSTDSKSSSSVTSSSSGMSAGTNSSSSLKTCPPEKEGNTRKDNGVWLICSNGFWVEMESSSSVSSSSYFDMTEQFNPDVEYGEFTDPRDGQKYRTVDIYDNVYKTTYTTFAENLNFGKMVMGGTVQGDSTKYCYDDDPWYCENGWGGLYTWSNAMGLPSVCDSVGINTSDCPYGLNVPNHQGVCPEGWHVMNDNEWANLSEISGRDVAYEMGSKVAGFGSKNRYGMSILPSGTYFVLADGSWRYEGIKIQANFWMAQQYTKDEKRALITWIESNDMHRGVPASKYEQGYSIRCVKDY